MVCERANQRQRRNTSKNITYSTGSEEQALEIGELGSGQAEQTRSIVLNSTGSPLVGGEGIGCKKDERGASVDDTSSRGQNIRGSAVADGLIDSPELACRGGGCQRNEGD